MRQESFWLSGERPTYPTLRGRRTSDAVVVGGGLSGLTAALWLAKAGLRVSLLEAEQLGSGSASRCAGIVSLANGLGYASLEQSRGISATNAYAQTQLSALASLKELCKGMDCGWQDADAQLVTNGDDAKLESEAAAMNRAGITVSTGKPTQCPFPATSALVCRDMGALNPEALIRGMAQSAEKLGLQIYEHSRVIALETNLALTDRGSVLAPYIVIATGYPIVNTPGWYFLRLSQRWSYLSPIRGGASFDGLYLDMNGQYTLRRLREGALLHFGGAVVGGSVDTSGSDLLASRYAQYLEPDSTGKVYAGVETFTPDGLPYIGAYSRKTPNLFVACGFGRQGLLGGVIAAQAVSAAILGLPTEAYEVYAGSRPASRRSVSFAMGIGGRFMKSMVHIRAPRCPHMGCKLKYRRGARIWECPCHGSRFDDIGHVFAAPAVEDAKINRR